MSADRSDFSDRPYLDDLHVRDDGTSDPERALLEAVLRQTQQMLESDLSERQLIGAMRERLRSVVHCSGVPKDGAQQDVDAQLAAGMVGVVLESSFRPLFPSEESWQKLCAAVARTLLQDPACRQRLAALRAKLAEGV